MRSAPCWLSLLSGIVFLAAAARVTAADDDAKLVAGTWKLTEMVRGDTKLDAETVARFQLVIEADRYTVTTPETVDKGTLKVDSKPTPKTMDITGVEGPNKDKTILAIYELAGDKLTICYSLEPGVRPTELKASGNPKRLLAIYERQKKP